MENEDSESQVENSNLENREMNTAKSCAERLASAQIQEPLNLNTEGHPTTPKEHFSKAKAGKKS